MIENLASRRGFLKGTALATSGLLLSFGLPGGLRTRAAMAENPAPTFIPNAFVRIDEGGVTLIMPHTEVGQGIYTSSAMLMAEELELGLEQVKLEAAPPDMSKYMDPILHDQATGGSTSTRSDWLRLRQAGAAARIMLVAAAASRWGVPPGECDVQKGMIRHDASDRELSYLDVATDAALQEVPEHIPLKKATEFRLIGTRAKRLDTPAKVNGSMIYGIDIRVPGMKHATLALSPVKGGRFVFLNEAAARSVPGVIDLVKSSDGDAVAVIGEHMWAAKQGLEALKAEWGSGPGGHISTSVIVANMEVASQEQGVVVRNDGNAAEAIAGHRSSCRQSISPRFFPTRRSNR
jgi:isoquinoline 1-oxidoreductase beta subunit